MAIKTVKIDYNGEKTGVEFETDLTFGDVEDLVSNCVDLTDVTNPKINLASYRTEILVKVIKKAPFKINDVVAIRLLDSKTVQKILREVLRYHPLANYIEDWMETFQNLEDLKKQDT